jgi:hypothetical protein
MPVTPDFVVQVATSVLAADMQFKILGDSSTATEKFTIGNVKASFGDQIAMSAHNRCRRRRRGRVVLMLSLSFSSRHRRVVVIVVIVVCARTR